MPPRMTLSLPERLAMAYTARNLLLAAMREKESNPLELVVGVSEAFDVLDSLAEEAAWRKCQAFDASRGLTPEEDEDEPLSVFYRRLATNLVSGLDFYLVRPKMLGHYASTTMHELDHLLDGLTSRMEQGASILDRV